MSMDGPIPGQSLTGEPRNAPWERPPETENPEEAIKHHLTRIGKPKVMNSILDAVDQEFPVSVITEIMLSGAVSQGIHSVDLSLMIAPVVHEYITELLESEGVEFNEFFPESDDTNVRKSIAVSQAISGLGKGAPKALEEEPEVAEEMPEEEPKRGLMSRPEPEGDMS